MTGGNLPSEGLLDTSIFIAVESGRALDRSRLPEHAYVSVITLAELELGALAADDPGERSVRMRTWARVSELQTLEVDLGASHEWAVIRRRLELAGRRVSINDLWVAAIAKANDLPVVTQDDDFDAIAEFGGPAVVKV